MESLAETIGPAPPDSVDLSASDGQQELSDRLSFNESAGFMAAAGTSWLLDAEDTDGAIQPLIPAAPNLTSRASTPAGPGRRLPHEPGTVLVQRLESRARVTDVEGRSVPQLGSRPSSRATPHRDLLEQGDQTADGTADTTRATPELPYHSYETMAELMRDEAGGVP